MMKNEIMLKNVTLVLLLVMVSDIAAAKVDSKQLHGVIPDYDVLVGGDSYLMEKKKDQLADVKKIEGYDFKFPKPKYIIDPVIIYIKNDEGVSRAIVGRGVLELQNFNTGTGEFKFKMSIDHLAFSKLPMPLNREKTDIPIKGVLYFDINNNDYTMLEGKYNQSTKQFVLSKSKDSIFYVAIHYFPGVIVLGKINETEAIPVSIDLK